MCPAQMPRTDNDELLRCADPGQGVANDPGGHNKNVKTDLDLAHEVDRALWSDPVFRAMDYDNIDVRVKGGIAHIYGHVSSLTNLHQAERLIQTIPGIMGLKNHLVMDDRLLAEVSTALGQIETTYDCKFFTGISHGVVLLSGDVDNINIKLLAEKCAANNPNVRGVINSIHILETDSHLTEEPFLQPTIGEEIFFRDGISGKVQQVVINPDSRRVVAMTLRGRFANQRQELKSLNNGGVSSPERIIVLSMNLIRFLTRVSGFLYINSNEKNQYLDFNPNHFFIPKKEWKAPYPYCPDDVLFLIEQQDVKDQLLQRFPRSSTMVSVVDQGMMDELAANDSLGG